MSMDDLSKKISNTLIEHSSDLVFTLYSDNKLVIENFLLINYYSRDLIKVKTDTGVLILTGVDMLFDTIGDETAVIKGKINSIEIVG